MKNPRPRSKKPAAPKSADVLAELDRTSRELRNARARRERAEAAFSAAEGDERKAQKAYATARTIALRAFPEVE